MHNYRIYILKVLTEKFQFYSNSEDVSAVRVISEIRPNTITKLEIILKEINFWCFYISFLDKL